MDLNPSGADYSVANGVSGGQQVGYARFQFDGDHAGLWNGTAGSWVDLNPAGAWDSCANGVSDGKQVGFAYIGGYEHAGMWSGTAESWVDLNPSGADYSYANGVSDGKQVGFANLGGYSHAGMWSGTAESWVDLHALLPAGVYSKSRANSVDVSAGEIWVAGSATSASTDQANAMLWHYDPKPTISIGQPSSTLTRGGPVSYTINYGDANAIALSSSKVTLNKTGTANGAISVSGTGSTTRTVTISSITGNGTLGISIAAGTATNADGSAHAAGPSATFKVDNTAPTVTIKQATAQADPTCVKPINFTVTFSEPVADFTSADVTIAGTAGGTKTKTFTGSGATYNVAVTGMTTSGTVIATIAAGVAHDSSRCGG